MIPTETEGPAKLAWHKSTRIKKKELQSDFTQDFGLDQKFRPLLEEELAETGQTAYYYNTKKRSNDVNYDEVLDTYGIAFVPILIKLEDGKAVGSVNLDTVADLPTLLAEE